ncbi:eukaryotic translation initiation factor 2D-like [Stegodyphus dumicola]|uniref:eukaryotic translation initiation factor 2D-like n=1 Tax=Stegodyphus dumicola TaxID=202533 RepID=UPI0015B312FC|nr:eukaryotic translation initiation factor 2D-like [Stegodyphus dumicola]
MFRKQYKVKTSTTIKGSDRRKLRSMVENSFPNLSPDDINNMIPNKSEMNQVKAMTHNGSVLVIYYTGSHPLFFQVGEVCYPTVYTLWKYPKLLPTITTVPAVLEKICNGADLMAPGIVINESTLSEMRNLKINEMCAVRIVGNLSPIAVGVALMSQEQLCEDGIKGKAVTIVHNYKDFLWQSGDKTDLPTIQEEMNERLHDINLSDEIPPVLLMDNEFDAENGNNSESLIVNETGSTKENYSSDDTNINKADSTVLNEEVKVDVASYTMDDILCQSFMAAIKVHGRKINLPILTSTFYSSYVLKACPSELNLDIKKTTYKKLSVFLKKMQKDGILQIKELTKGVESIVSVNTDCDTIKTFFIDPLFKSHLQAQKAEKSADPESTANIQENYKFPVVTELFVISAQVKLIFEFSGMRKGDSVPGSAVRDVLKHYVKENSLQNERSPREVILDPVLCDCVSKKESKTVMTWEELYEAIVNKMPHAYQIAFDGKEPVIKKGKLEPIQITVDTRTGNKKVTLIQNLETYGINPEKLAQHVQVAVAASTSVALTQNGKGTIVLIQGNQVKYLQKLFLEMFKVPRKYLRGLENLPTKKK